MKELDNRKTEGKSMQSTITRTPLNVSDRCDRCGAQAFVRVYLDQESTLQFCAHHFREHEVKLRGVAIDIQDESESIDQEAQEVEPTF